MEPTVGRLDDPRQVGRPTHSRFFRRPTVGRFLGAQKSRIYRACSTPNFSAKIFVGEE